MHIRDFHRLEVNTIATHPFIPIPNVVQLLMRFTREGQLLESVFYVKNAVAWTEESIVALVNSALTSIETTSGLMGLLPNNTQLTSVKARDMTTETGLSYEAAPLTPTVGGRDAPSLPNSVTLAIHKASLAGGKHSKARVYFPGLAEDILATPNTVTALFANLVCSAYRQFMADINAVSGLTLGFVELMDAKVWLTVGVFHAILDFICKDLIIDNQRRRLPGRGR
jgi:hypothetical protein